MIFHKGKWPVIGYYSGNISLCMHFRLTKYHACSKTINEHSRSVMEWFNVSKGYQVFPAFCTANSVLQKGHFKILSLAKLRQHKSSFVFVNTVNATKRPPSHPFRRGSECKNMSFRGKIWEWKIIHELLYYWTIVINQISKFSKILYLRFITKILACWHSLTYFLKGA